MFLDDRIRFYEEIIEQDPSSKLFFPLAKLYVEKQDIEKGIAILTTGLDRNPDHMEARLFLIELLNKKDLLDEALIHIEKIEHIFSSYPHFWKTWAESLSKRGNNDLAGFVFLMGHVFDSNKGASVGETLYLALNRSAKEPATSLESQSSSVNTEENLKEQTGHDQEEIEFKTKTMGDILMLQGDYRGALEIYEDLLKKNPEGSKREELEKCIKKAKQGLKSGVLSPKDVTKKQSVKKRNLLSRLKLLAQRLEARAY